MFPLDVFVSLGAGHAVPAGVYQYLAASEALVRVGGATVEDLAQCSLEPELLRTASVAVFFVATFERTIYKYGERGYRFVLLEAGHAAQNCLLASEALDLSALAYGGMVDREVERVLGLDGAQRSLVHVVLVGGRATP